MVNLFEVMPVLALALMICLIPLISDGPTQWPPPSESDPSKQS